MRGKGRGREGEKDEEKEKGEVTVKQQSRTIGIDNICIR